MAHILLAYGTTEGHTAEVVRRMADRMEGRGHRTVLLPVDEAAPPLSLDAFDGAVLGGSVHTGRFQRAVRTFARQHRAFLESVPSAFFAVCLAATEDTEEARSEVEAYVERFAEDTGWVPRDVGVFAGKIAYTRYSFVKRFVMKQIARSSGLSTDTSRDHDYTDWEAVDAFADAFVDTVVSEARDRAAGAPREEVG